MAPGPIMRRRKTVWHRWDKHPPPSPDLNSFLELLLWTRLVKSSYCRSRLRANTGTGLQGLMPSRDEAVLNAVVRAVDQVWTRGQTWAGRGQGMTPSEQGYPVSPCLVLQTSHRKACLARLRLSPLFPSAFSFVFLWGSSVCLLR